MTEERGKFGFNFGTVVWLIILSVYLIAGGAYYLNYYSDTSKNLQNQSLEAYKQLGYPEGFVEETMGTAGGNLAGRLRAEIRYVKKPETEQEREALKEKVDKYYAQKLAQHGWTKVPGYKYLYQRGEHQWMDIAIHPYGEIISVYASTTLFKDYAVIKSIVAKEETYPY